MPTQVPTASEPGFATLVQEIVNDIRDLIGQQVRFAKAEIKSDLRKSITAATLFALGAVSLLLGVVFLGLTAVHLLHWLTAVGQIDPARLPLWGCYAIVTGLFLASGAVLAFLGKKTWDAFTPLPTQTVQTLKENVEWITNSK
jgi:hypothetical protein